MRPVHVSNLLRAKNGAVPAVVLIIKNAQESCSRQNEQGTQPRTCMMKMHAPAQNAANGAAVTTSLKYAATKSRLPVLRQNLDPSAGRVPAW